MKTQAFLMAMVACLVSVQLVVAGEEESVKVRPITLQIVSGNFETNRPIPFNIERRMAVGLLVESETLPLAAIDGWSSTMEKLSDDTGAALNEPRGTFSFSPYISSNGHAASVTFDLSNAPTQGAKTITASGKLRIIFGKKKETFELKDVPIAEQSLDVPRQKFSIIRISEQMGFADPDKRSGHIPVNNICFRAEGESSPWVESIAFFDQTGHPLKAYRTGATVTNSGSNPAASFAEWNYSLPRDIKQATVKITLWTERETRLVPFNFTVGIGL